MKKMIKRWMTLWMAVVLMAAAIPMTVLAFPGDDGIITVDSTPKGKIGRNMTVSFTINNYDAEDWEDVEVGFEEDYFYTSPGALEGGGVFPFEITESTFATKHVGKVSGRKGDKPGKRKVSLSARVRADLTPGYYVVSIVVGDNGNHPTYAGTVTIWVDQPTGADENM